MKTVSNIEEICSAVDEYEHICIFVKTLEDYAAFNKMIIESDKVRVGNKDAWESDFKNGTYIHDFDNTKYQYLGVDYLIVFAMDEYDDGNYTFYFGSEIMVDSEKDLIFSPNQFSVDLL